jgi:chitosanase
MDADTKKKIISIVNCFEMGTPHIQYDQITLLHDGPGKILQFTGSVGFTEAYNLKKVIQLYIDKGGELSKEFARYLPDMGKKFTLARDTKFHKLWKESAEEQLMKDAQDEIYESTYFLPAEKWSETAGFELPLSYLVVFDSFLQSGSIMKMLRNRFPETLPNNGGTEKEWIRAYAKTRLNWLKNHSRVAVRNSAYRMRDITKIINDDDWELENPVSANGIIIP